MPTSKVICVGIAVMDSIYRVPWIPAEPTKVFAQSYSEIGGGCAATGAVAVARLGGKAELWARAGADPVGARIIEELAGWGVEPHVRQIPGRQSSVSAVLVDERGERLVTAFMDPNLDTDPSWLPLDRIAQADAVLVDSRWLQASAAVLRAACAAGVPSILDADLTPDDNVSVLAPLADYVVFAAPALARFAGVDDAASGLAKAQKLCRGIMGVTQGAAGFYWLENGDVQSEPGIPVTAVDTLGAGDVFHGAFALAIAEGKRIREAGRFANAAAALKCARPNGRAGIPDRVEVEKLLLRAGNE